MVFPLVSAKILMKAIGNLTQHSPCRHINNRLEVQRDGSPCLGTDYCRCSLYHINIISIRQQVQLCINIYLGNQITVLYSPCPTSSNWASIFASLSNLQSLLSTGGKHKERMAIYSSPKIDFTKMLSVFVSEYFIPGIVVKQLCSESAHGQTDAQTYTHRGLIILPIQVTSKVKMLHGVSFPPSPRIVGGSAPGIFFFVFFLTGINWASHWILYCSSLIATDVATFNSGCQ